jgi:hypothetical protein
MTAPSQCSSLLLLLTHMRCAVASIPLQAQRMAGFPMQGAAAAAQAQMAAAQAGQLQQANSGQLQQAGSMQGMMWPQMQLMQQQQGGNPAVAAAQQQQPLAAAAAAQQQQQAAPGQLPPTG